MAERPLLCYQTKHDGSEIFVEIEKELTYGPE